MWLGMTVASLPTLALPSIYLHLMRQDGRDRWFVYAFMTPFLLVGLLLGYFGLRALLRIVVRGSWQLELPDEGGVLGHPLSATLFPTRSRSPTAELTCRVRCIRMSRNTRASARGNIETLWERTWTTSTAMIQPQVGFALELPLPAYGEPTQMDRTGSGVQWQLNVVVPLQDGSEEPVFDVPVRR
ncbi:MAG: hypothetical protein IPK07_21425 [Deltaproteobacteria bacterium]|nr:hypothetical protein [Deltaproteobacteria bacterium]